MTYGMPYPQPALAQRGAAFRSPRQMLRPYPSAPPPGPSLLREVTLESERQLDRIGQEVGGSAVLRPDGDTYQRRPGRMASATQDGLQFVGGGDVVCGDAAGAGGGAKVDGRSGGALHAGGGVGAVIEHDEQQFLGLGEANGGQGRKAHQHPAVALNRQHLVEAFG